MSHKAKILYIINDLDVAGVETVVMNYIRNLYKDSFFDVYVLTLQNPTTSAYEIEALEKGFKVKYMNLKHPEISHIPGVNSLRRFRPVYRAIKEINPDIVHTHETGNLIHSLLPIVLLNVPIRIHTLHGTPTLYDFVSHITAKIAFRFLHFHPICITEEQAQQAQKSYGFKNYTLIRNGTDIEKYNIVESKTDIRRSLSLSADDYILGTVAGLRPVKNLDYMLELFKEFATKHSNAKLLLAGDGEERDHLEMLANELNISDKVIFLGVRTDVERIYKAMDVFLLTSFSEASPIVFIEAQLSGLSCVVSSAVPASNVFSDKVNILSLEDSKVKWIEAIEGKLSYNEVTCTKNDFSMETFINKTKELYLKSFNLIN